MELILDTPLSYHLVCNNSGYILHAGRKISLDTRKTKQRKVIKKPSLKQIHSLGFI